MNELLTKKASNQQPIKILAGSSLKSSAARSASPSISVNSLSTMGRSASENDSYPLPLKTDPELRYRSNQSKRVVETMNLRLHSNISDVDDELVRKKQFTEKIYNLWKNECQIRLTHQSSHEKS